MRTVYEGMATPWGRADTAINLGEGVGLVSTPGHGGMKLDRERNARIPAPLRNGDGWYEEDDEISIPIHYYPDSWRKLIPTWGGDDAMADRHIAMAGERVRRMLERRAPGANLELGRA